MNKEILTVIVICALLIMACGSESKKIRNLELPPIDLSTIQDSTYVGQYVHHDNLYKVEVAVENHRIIEINVLSSEGDKYDIRALAVLDRVIEEQSLDVDAVTGATKSSKLYLICIYHALTGEEISLNKQCIKKNWHVISYRVHASTLVIAGIPFVLCPYT